MKILKGFLYFVLTMCVFWAFLVLFGPRILASSLEVAYGKRIIVSEIAVTPRLEVKLRGVKYNGLVLPKLGEIYGSSRSITLQPMDLLKLVPKIRVSSTVTQLDNVLSFESLNLEVNFQAFLNFDLVEFSGTLKNIYDKSVGVAEGLSVSGQFDNDKALLKNLQFSADGVRLKLNHGVDMQASLASLSGSLDFWDFNRSTKNQKAVVEVYSEDVLMGSAKNSLKDFSLKAEVTAAGVLAKINASDINYGTEYEASELITQIFLPGVTDLRDAVFELDINSASFPSIRKYTTDGSLRWVSGKLTLSEFDSYVVEVQMEIDLLQLQNNGVFMADISGSNISLFADYQKQLKPVIGFNLDARLSDEINLKSTNTIQLDTANLASCATSPCTVSNIQSEYTITIDDTNLSGKLFCPEANCGGSDSSHRIKTVNTNKFFNALMRSNVLNPLLTASIFSQIASGMKVDQGHDINF